MGEIGGIRRTLEALPPGVSLMLDMSLAIVFEVVRWGCDGVIM